MLKALVYFVHSSPFAIYYWVQVLRSFPLCQPHQQLIAFSSLKSTKSVLAQIYEKRNIHTNSKHNIFEELLEKWRNRLRRGGLSSDGLSSEFPHYTMMHIWLGPVINWLKSPKDWLFQPSSGGIVSHIFTVLQTSQISFSNQIQASGKRKTQICYQVHLYRSGTMFLLK